jgi:hypothetical protein
LERAFATASTSRFLYLPNHPIVGGRPKGILVTIYSLHPNRGKIQILATYSGSAAVTSSTVTSLDGPALAAPIVDALNRISACATVPVSVWDARGGGFRSYPSGHLAALTDRAAREELLTGRHSLWYELVKLLLHKALADLDEAAATAPAPVRTAIEEELGVEARGLRHELAEYAEGISPPETEDRRYWDFEAPFVVFDGGMDALSSDTRRRLNNAEEGVTAEQLRVGVGDLRLLVDAHALCVSDDAMLEVANFTIFDEPDGSDRNYLTVDAPHPNGAGPSSWRIEIGRWEPDDPDDEYGDATGRSLLCCACPTPPTASEIAEVLSQGAGRPEQLTAWAKTPVGQTLAGTTFVVTERNDDD